MRHRDVKLHLTMQRALGALLMVCACSDSRTLPSELTSSTWVRYHHWEDEPPCSEALSHMDTVVDFVTRRFELKVRPIDFYKFRESEAELVSRICLGGAQSCSERNEIFTKGWLHDHELGHGVFHQVGDPPQLFDEGIAVVLGCGFSGFAGSVIDTSLDLERLIDDTAWFAEQSGAAYDAAGSFVRFLIDQHGEKAFVDFYSKAPSSDVARAKEEFSRAFGRSMADALAAWRASSPPNSGADCLLAEDPCAEPAPLLDAASTQPVTQALSCAPRVVSVGGPDAIAVSVSSSEVPVTVAFERCGPQPVRDLVAIAPEVLQRVDPQVAGVVSVGRELELRSFGFSGRGRLRITPARGADLRGGALDPQADPYGGPYSGQLTFRALPSPEAAFSSGCPATPIPLGANAWGLQLSAPLASLPQGASQAVLRGPPFTVKAQQFSGANVSFRCGSTCAPDPGCPGGPVEIVSASVSRPASPGDARFTVRWVVEH